jgi:uncharacterized protein
VSLSEGVPADPAGDPSGWLDAASQDRERWARPVRWGLGDVLLGLFAAHLLATVVGGALLYVLGYTEDGDLDRAAISVLFLVQLPLWVGYLVVAWWASRAKGNGLRSDFGLRASGRDAVLGLGIGAAVQLIVVPLLYFPILWIWSDQDPSDVARELTDRATGPFDALVLVVIVVVCAPIVEEIFYRGLVLRSFENKWGTGWAVAFSSVLFGAIHLQILQFPALVTFGLVAALLTVRTRRLGPAIFAHVGFNGVTVAVLLLAG